uniref:Uncharacterized protein n=1 Tax=Anopheles melas TaxID=34690 RepID=A0A182UH70_9DIPT
MEYLITSFARLPASSSSSSHSNVARKQSSNPSATLSTPRSGRFPSSCASEVTDLPTSPHGTMCPNQPRSTSQLRASPCVVTYRLACMPSAQIFRSPIQTPVSAVVPARSPYRRHSSITVRSRWHTYQRTLGWKCFRSSIGYATSCPGPWNVISPPRLVRTKSAPSARSRPSSVSS